jgi:hypothetical protein
MTAGELRRVTRFIRWHLAYILLVTAFFTAVYLTGNFRVSVFFQEKFLFLVMAPLSTLLFVLLSPWRSAWKEALVGLYRRVEGQEIFFALGVFVFLFGFFVYSLFLWGLGALGPSLFYM